MTSRPAELPPHCAVLRLGCRRAACETEAGDRSTAQVLEYYRAFADEFDLRRHIRFRTKVLSAELTLDEPDLPPANGAHENGAAKPASSAPCWRVTSLAAGCSGDSEKVRDVQRPSAVFAAVHGLMQGGSPLLSRPGGPEVS